MKKTFRTRTYEIYTDKLKNGHKVRFAFLTDLHGLIYGKHQSSLFYSQTSGPFEEGNHKRAIFYNNMKRPSPPT